MEIKSVQVSEEPAIGESVEIFVDSARGTVRLEVLKSIRVIDIIRAVVEKIKLGSSEIYELVYEGTVLKPERPIESYEIKSGSHLDIVRVTLVG